jgi:hypothetical protein
MTSPANIQGVVSTTIKNRDGEMMTAIVPAERCGDEIRIDNEHIETLHFLMLAAGVSSVELEFSEVRG